MIHMRINEIEVIIISSNTIFILFSVSECGNLFHKIECQLCLNVTVVTWLSYKMEFACGLPV